jgi:hypothetical protein
MDIHARHFGWKSSRACGPNQQCVEVARLSPDAIGVRDSYQTGPAAPILCFGRTDWARFVTRVKNGDADRLR